MMIKDALIYTFFRDWKFLKFYNTKFKVVQYNIIILECVYSNISIAPLVP